MSEYSEGGYGDADTEAGTEGDAYEGASVSGKSAYSGISGKSAYSGISGKSAYSEKSAYSGKTGVSAKYGLSSKYEDVTPSEPAKPSRPPSVAPPPQPSDKAPPQSVKLPPSYPSERVESQLDCSCFLWSFIWLSVLVLFAWPFSVAISALYGFVSPMISLIGIEDISDSLLEGVNVGRQCARNARNGVPMI